MRRGLGFLVAGDVLAASVVVTGGPAAGDVPSAGSATETAYTAGRYIVTFADEPIASYDGYVRGFPATRPAAGEKLDPDSPVIAAP
jgi:hypothetical protein